MATISKPLFLMTLFLMLANQLVHSQDVTSFRYVTFSPGTPGLSYQGGAHVQQGSTFLSLTDTDSRGLPINSNVGRVVYSHPVRFWERSSARQANFETTITFLITPSRNGVADGIAFFIAPVNTTIPSGATGGNLGIFGSSGTTPNLFAVEFDNFVNTWDPNFPHIGIDNGSRTSIVTRKFESGARGQQVIAHIYYYAITNTITVVATTASEATSLSHVFDLKTILPEQVVVGISAATGQTAALHSILSWSFTSTLVYTNVNNVNNVTNNEETYIRKNMY